jgi:eukaryotic-like serine/threonine-protein kinase
MLRIGEMLRERYRIDALLGEGGMGTVYMAFDTRKECSVAIKELRLDDLPTDPDNTIREDGTLQHKSRPVSREQALKQFRNEADLLIRLAHENLPQVEDYFDIGDQGYFVMTLIEGQNLAEVVELRGSGFSEETVRDWFYQIASALAYCHANHVIHRDVKPENLILTSEGKIYLVDFGIAKSSTDSTSPATTVGARAFTEHYSPPEQRPGGGGTDERTDIYAFGAVLYFLITGTPPLDSQMRSSGTTIRLPSSINQQISPALESMIMRCLRLPKAERPQSVAAMQVLLETEMPASVVDLVISNRQFDQDRLLQAVLKPTRSTPIPETQALPVSSTAAPNPEKNEQLEATPPALGNRIQPSATPADPSEPTNQPPAKPAPFTAISSPLNRPEKADRWNLAALRHSRQWRWMAAGGLLILVVAGVILGLGILDQRKSPRTALHQLQASNDAYTVVETYALIEDTPHGLLANDRNVDMAVLSVVLGKGPAHGLLKLNIDGSFTYAPEKDFTGTDTFTYQFVPQDSPDTALRSDPLTVTIRVLPLFRIWMPVIGK